MYSASETKSRIKQICKERGEKIDSLPGKCGLGPNAIRQISDKTGMGSFNLARIADFLDCSVDFLLGRVDNVDINRGLAAETAFAAIAEKYERLDEADRGAVNGYIDRLLEAEKYRAESDAGEKLA